MKASGTWLADAEREEIFVPVDLKDALAAVHQNQEAPGGWETVVCESRGREATGPDGEHAHLDDTVVLVRRSA